MSRFWLYPVLLFAACGLGFRISHLLMSNAWQGASPLYQTWKVSGPMVMGAYPKLEYYGDPKEPAFFGPDGASSAPASLVSPRFVAPERVSFTLMGDLTVSANTLYFERLDNLERSTVVFRFPSDRRVMWTFPSDWVGKPVQLVLHVADWGRGFCLTVPERLTWWMLGGGILQDSLLPGQLVLAFGFFWAPGLLLGVPVSRRLELGPAGPLLVAMPMSCLAGYVAFWLFFWNPTVGWLWAAGSTFCSSVALLVLLRTHRSFRTSLASAQVALPLASSALVGLFYVSLLFTVHLGEGISLQPAIRFMDSNLAVNGQLPGRFANGLVEGRDLRSLAATAVHSSDRPPLQAGIDLLLFPLCQAMGLSSHAGFVLTGWVAECCWVPGVWLVCTAVGLTRLQTGRTLLLLTLTGFCLINTTFTWPKILGAGLALFAVRLALFPDAETVGRPRGWAVLFGASAALGLLSHGGIVFTVLPLSLFLFVPRYYPGVSRLFLAAGVAMLLLVPWSLYQSCYDPPGDWLIKEHLAGNPKASGGAARAIVEAYRSLPIDQVLANKLANLRDFFTFRGKSTQFQEVGPGDNPMAFWPRDSRRSAGASFTRSSGRWGF